MRGFSAMLALVLLFAAPVFAAQYDLADSEDSDTAAWGEQVLAALGYSLAVGDFDGDGQDDIAAGAPGQDAFRGAVVLLLSSEGFLDRAIDLAAGDADVTISGEAGQYLGYALAAGDFNDDGIDDLAVGAARAPGPSDEDALGAAFVFFGRANWPATLSTTAGPDAIIWGEKTAGQFGTTLAAGDFDGDQVDDLFVAAPLFEDVGASAAGKVYGFLGASVAGVIDLRPATTEADIEVVGEAGGERLGQTVAVGDLDGDGLADLVLGAPSVAPPAPGSKEGFPGQALVIFGREVVGVLRIDLAVDTPDVRLTPSLPSNNLGAALAIGDVNSDGLGDLVLGGPNLPASKSTAGDVYVVHGQMVWPETIDLAVADLTIHGALAGERFGAALAVGDITGDCVDDLLIGAPRFGNLSFAHAYVIEGDPEYPLQYVIDLAVDGAALHTVIGAEALDQTGAVVATGDFDDDGVSDLLLGAPANNGPSGNREDAGAFFAILATATNQPPVADAGPDRQTVVNVPVVLDGRGSSDAEGAELTYTWTQTAGPEAVALFDPTSATPLLTPTLTGTYRFELLVADCVFTSDADQVVVTVDPFPTGDDDDATGDDDAADDDDATDDDAPGASDDDGDIWEDEDNDDTGVYGGGGCTG
jgi:K319L-like, PKD domain/FG-GAP repeat